MKYEVYTDITVRSGFDVFEFMSIGKKGEILKRVAFVKTLGKDVYNLEFGDVDDNNEINDYVVTDNGDRNKVLATVVSIVEAYTKRFPERWIVFKGSNAQRTRLYRMAVGIHLHELSSTYIIFAYCNGVMVLFEKNMEIDAFLIRRKKT